MNLKMPAMCISQQTMMALFAEGRSFVSERVVKSDVKDERSEAISTQARGALRVDVSCIDYQNALRFTQVQVLMDATFARGAS